MCVGGGDAFFMCMGMCAGTRGQMLIFKCLPLLFSTNFFEIESLTEYGVGNIAGWRALRIHLSLPPPSLDVNDVLLHLAVYMVAGDRNSGVPVHVLSQPFTNLVIPPSSPHS